MRTHVVSLWNHTQHLSWLSHHKHRFLTSDLHGSQICGIEWGLQWYHCNTKQRMTMRWFKETVLWKHLQTRTTPDFKCDWKYWLHLKMKMTLQWPSVWRYSKCVATNLFILYSIAISAHSSFSSENDIWQRIKVLCLSFKTWVEYSNKCCHFVFGQI